MQWGGGVWAEEGLGALQAHRFAKGGCEVMVSPQKPRSMHGVSLGQTGERVLVGRMVVVGGGTVSRGRGGGDRLTVGAASSSISPQVEALFFSRSETTPARIPPAKRRGGF